MLGAGVFSALGAMSGTSLDGVDAAVLVTDGTLIFEFGESAYRAYTPAERAILQAALGKWPGADLAAAQDVVITAHKEVLRGFEPPDLVGFHGQTLAHDPRGRGTHQLGDGARLAQQLGCPVVWDFRSADIQLGGEGAPLAPVFHFACAKWAGLTTPVAFLNLGGVGNLTYVDPRCNAPEDDGALLAFDTGPANAPVNDLMQTRLGRAMDEGGVLAGQGQIDRNAVSAFLQDPYFNRMPPKSLDRDSFANVLDQVAGLGDADAVATLTAMSACTVVAQMDLCPQAPSALYLTGGGRHNATLVAMIAEGVQCPVAPVEDINLDGDMLEAQAFAYLAVRIAKGLPTSFPSTTGVAAAVSGGQMSQPEVKNATG